MISIIIPALNEERNLKKTVEGVLQAANESGGIPLEIIIVNDGSTDGTQNVINELTKEHQNIRSIINEKNLGLGHSFKKALNILQYDKFIVVPGDNDMPKELMVSMFKNVNKADLIMAYFLNKELRGRLRNFLSSLFSIFYSAIFNVYVLYVNGPCIYPTQKVRKLKLNSKRFSIIAEMTTKSLLSGCSFYEVGGYMQTGESGSSAVSIKNCYEVMSSFIKLFVEVKIINRKEFNKKMNRVY